MISARGTALFPRKWLAVDEFHHQEPMTVVDAVVAQPYDARKAHPLEGGHLVADQGRTRVVDDRTQH
ncbi:MAG: hypothetical protein R3F65_06550 [bacterium]